MERWRGSELDRRVTVTDIFHAGNHGVLGSDIVRQVECCELIRMKRTRREHSKRNAIVVQRHLFEKQPVPQLSRCRYEARRTTRILRRHA
jgi:hypothetical protein